MRKRTELDDSMGHLLQLSIYLATGVSDFDTAIELSQHDMDKIISTFSSSSFNSESAESWLSMSAMETSTEAFNKTGDDTFVAALDGPLDPLDFMLEEFPTDHIWDDPWMDTGREA